VTPWSSWETAACDLCGADLEVCTDAPAGAYDGDPIRCVSGHTGRVTADEGEAWVTMYDQTAEAADYAAWAEAAAARVAWAEAANAAADSAAAGGGE